MKLFLLFVPVIPIISSLLILFLNNKKDKLAGIIATIGVFISFALLLFLYDKTLIIQTELFNVGKLSFLAGLQLNGLSWFVSLIVAFVGLLVSIYSISYMKGCSCYYFGVSSFFIGSMITLVLSSSFLLMYAAWEGVGLSSFLLIGYWYKKDESRLAARKAFLMTRIGDTGFFLGMLLLLYISGTLEIDKAVHQQLPFSYINLIAILFLIAAVGKSAQLPFSAWLPGAMAGPTPVSALIHSATMVAAGVYLIVRIFPLFEASHLARNLVLYIGAFTALCAAIVAASRTDFKRILAWSTISQIGEMFFVLGIGGKLAAIFHLAAHAVFKSTLFLSAGALSHSTSTRNIDELGGLYKKLPLVFSVFLISALALAGFPPFAGFWSEEEILADSFGHGFLPGLFMLILILLAGIYISRAGFSIFGNWKGMKNPKTEKLSNLILSPMILLAITAAVIGIILKLYLTDILRFEKVYHLSWSWRTAAIFISAAGLSIGSYKVYKDGPKPFFKKTSFFIISSVNGIVSMFAYISEKLTYIVQTFESFFNSLARNVSNFILQSTETVEQGEIIFNKSALFTSKFILSSSAFTDDFEKYGFERGTKDLTDFLSLSSQRVKSVQGGKIFVYLLGLTVWLILVTAASIIILIN